MADTRAAEQSVNTNTNTNTNTDDSEPDRTSNRPQVPDQAAGILRRALSLGATDVHLDVHGETARLRYRVDGNVAESEQLNAAQAMRLINQFRVAAQLDAEAILKPLEGQLQWSNDDATMRDVRITIVPTSPNGAGLHLRLLTAPDEWHTISNLGLTGEDLATIHRRLETPEGLILVAGPTGSGKTTTLYAMARLDQLKNSVAVSIEDPVEFDLPWVRQLQVDEDHELSMEQGLRVLLRMDPDAILVGEIRDEASANIAARAAMSGRLVIATIHARDEAGAIDALHYLNVPHYVIGNALRLVIAQNLVPVLCRECAHQRRTEAFEKEFFEKASLQVPAHVYEPAGCEACGERGYRGRTGVFGVQTIDKETGIWLCNGPHQHEIRKRFAHGELQSIHADALRKAKDGVTSMREVIRLIG